LSIGKTGLRPFFGHQLRYRRQKAGFLPAALKLACGRFSDINFVAAGKKRGFCRLR